MATGYVYFIFSSEYNKERNEIEKGFGKEFVCGTVVANGSKKEYSFLSKNADIDEYCDARIVAEGEASTMVYNKPIIRVRRK